MITVIFYGLDEFVVGRLSRELTPGLAKLYEVDEDDVNFVAPNNMFFHNGVEQTSWNVLIHVHAPMKVSVLQDEIAQYLTRAIGEIAIHKIIEFYYYSSDNRYESINKDYPRFITEENIVDTEYEEDEDDDCCCGDHHTHEDRDEGEGEDEIYTDDIFQDFNGK